MLVLTRREGERVLIGDNIIIEINEISKGQVRIAFDAPEDIKILREEIAGRDKVAK